VHEIRLYREELAALKAENEKLTQEMEFYRGLSVLRSEGVTSIDGGKTAQNLHELWTERDDLKVERDWLLKDKERLDWQEHHCATAHCNFCTPAWTVTPCGPAGEDLEPSHGGSLRQAIDLARWQANR